MSAVVAGNIIYADDNNDLEARIAALEASPRIGQLVTYDVQTSDSSTFTSETSIATVTFTEVSGTIYLVEVVVSLASGTVTDIVQGAIRDSTVGGTELASGRCAAQTSDQARGVGISLAYRYASASNGSKTFVISGQRVSGGGNVKREAGTDHPMLTTVRRVG